MSQRRNTLVPGPRVGTRRWRLWFADFDWGLFLIVLLIAGIGLANLYSATYTTQRSGKFDQQVIRIAMGFVCFFAFSIIDYRSLQRWAWLTHVLAAVAIVSVHIFFDAVKGSQRWIILGPLRVQPSELAKLAVILSLARILSAWSTREYSPKAVIFAVGALAVPVVLVAVQPDLGSAILLSVIILSVALMLVPTVWPFGVVGFSVLVVLPRLGRHVWENMHAYQQRRVLAFLDPTTDPTGAAWQTRQSVKAVGSGRTFGKGYMEATQNQFNFLPEHWTDFPFSVWAEEWGFAGSVGLLLLFMLLVGWIVNVAVHAKTIFAQAICIGVAAMIFWHTVVNVLMVLGWAPVVGVPLPLISYGGSSVLTVMIGLGLVGSVSKRRRS